MTSILPTLIFLFGLWNFPGIIEGSHIVVRNNCRHPVWVGTNGQTEGNRKWSNPGNGGFLLSSGHSRELWVEEGWAGRIWGRTNCNSRGRCETGDCGSIQCTRSGVPPATLAEMKMDGWGGLDFYAISLVDGGNLRMRIKPRFGNCREGSCPHDMTRDCPRELRVYAGRRVVACKSKGGVQVFRDYARRVCPHAYGFWNDDTKTLSCRSPRKAGSIFDITFC